MLQSWPIIIYPPIVVGIAYTVGFLICKIFKIEKDIRKVFISSLVFHTTSIPLVIVAMMLLHFQKIKLQAHVVLHI
jgi:hypothetical protein